MSRSAPIVCARLTIPIALLLSTTAAAQQQRPASSTSMPPSGGSMTVNIGPKNKIEFPYGMQTFGPREGIKLNEDVTRLPGWVIEGAPGKVSARIAETPPAFVVPGTRPARWLDLHDQGLAFGEALHTPTVEAPAPWTYAWMLRLRIETAPAVGSDLPVFAVQHAAAGVLQDAWGVRLGTNSASLFMTEIWGEEPVELPLFDYAGATALGEWIDLRIVADLTRRTLTAFVNGAETAETRTRPHAATDVTTLRLSYHGTGAGNLVTLQLDEVGVAFLNPTCVEDHTYDFETEDDFATPLVNGQKIDMGGEFGDELNVSGAGGQGPAIFDSTPAGPNDPSQDLDLLVGTGNILIVQTDAATNPPLVGDVFPRPNDDEDGGSFAFGFTRPCMPLSIDLIDVDAAGNEGMTVTMVDFSALTRTYTVPANWTGDLVAAEPGIGTLDLQTLLPQAGFGSMATAAEDMGFDPSAVVSMSVTLGGSGAVDNLHVVIPCVMVTFDNEDDSTPVFAGTPLVDGQDLSTPPEFGIEMALTSAGANAGAAIFDSTPGGPNDPGPDNDLLVGLGNILILQSNNVASHSVQTVPGIFDTPNDDVNGGTLFFTFPPSVQVHQLDFIDADEEEVTGIIVTLTDSLARTRVFTIPPAWTEDLLNDGPPAVRTLDLDSLAPQPGFAAVATAVEDLGFDADDVVSMTVSLGGAQAMDNICFCP
ncbi:MAG TPA: hypothetical protein VF530_04005 [Planctomycetota bacterium]